MHLWRALSSNAPFPGTTRASSTLGRRPAARYLVAADRARRPLWSLVTAGDRHSREPGVRSCRCECVSPGCYGYTVEQTAGNDDLRMDFVGDKREWVASIPWWRISMLGGTLTLTDAAVSFTPLASLGRTRRYALEDVKDVSVAADRPPRLRLTMFNDRSLNLIILPARNLPVWTRDASARDQAVAAINERLMRK